MSKNEEETPVAPQAAQPETPADLKAAKPRVIEKVDPFALGAIRYPWGYPSPNAEE